MDAKRNPRIVIGVGDLLGCGYYRCALPYRHLSSLGFDVLLTNRLTYPSPELEGVDLLVLQRQHNPNVFEIARLVKHNGGKVLVELDDYFHDIPSNNPAKGAYTKGGDALLFLEKFMQLADLMTVSTEYLKTMYSKFNSNIFVCPNKMDVNTFQTHNCRPRFSDEFRLGWAGSGTHHDDLMTIVQPISELMYENKNIKLIFIGQFYKNLFPFSLHNRMEHIGHTFPVEDGKSMFFSKKTVNPVVEYYQLLNTANLDAAIAPILQVTFNRAKSYVKLIEYGACGIPFVASSFGPYNQFIDEADKWDRSKPVGLLADRNIEWKKQIKKLINNEELRQELTNNNISNIDVNHTIEHGVINWVNALASVSILPGSEPGTYEESIVKS